MRSICSTREQETAAATIQSEADLRERLLHDARQQLGIQEPILERTEAVDVNANADRHVESLSDLDEDPEVSHLCELTLYPYAPSTRYIMCQRKTHVLNAAVLVLIRMSVYTYLHFHV